MARGPNSGAQSRLGLGCMRLSTERERDESGSMAVLHAAFDAGITVLDTADAYAWDDSERGHNERLIGRALATWAGDRSLIRIATKGGFRRPDGRWQPDARGLPVRCVWLSTSLEEAQMNAAWRIVERYGPLPGDQELESLRAADVAAFLPGVQFRDQRQLEPPELSEGFSGIDIVPFVRQLDAAFANRAIILWCDEVLLRSRSGSRVPLTPEDVEVVANRVEMLRRYRDAGYRLLAISWQPDIVNGAQSADGVAAVVRRVCDLLGVDIEVEYCPHAPGPPTPTRPAQCKYVGSGPQDPGFARRLGSSGGRGDRLSSAVYCPP